jgi:hypothetical protein
MIKNGGMIRLCNLIEEGINSRINWRCLTEKYKGHREDFHIGATLGDYGRDFIYLHCKHVIGKIEVMRYEENIGHLNIEDISVGSDKYYSRDDRFGRIQILKGKIKSLTNKRRKRDKLEIVVDKLVEIDGFPVIINTCFSRFVPEKRIKKEEDVMQKIYGEDFGYIIVAPEIYLNSRSARVFLNNQNGMIANLGMSKGKFLKKAVYALEKYGLRIRKTGVDLIGSI